ncbi:hypothetical protein diail_11527 [Diaporthe ilicicola]|nr:hypothetical protein diail_11527 [Diaporthe ilicicola]
MSWNNGGGFGDGGFGGGDFDGGAVGADKSFGGGGTSGAFDGGFGDSSGGVDGGGGPGGDDRACFSCGKVGHNKADCPNRPPARCGNCKKDGHYITECPDPLVCPRCTGSHMVRECPEPMKCYHCEGEHMAKECPVYVATCKNCEESGHTAVECQNARKVNRSHLPDMTGEEAWKLLEKAINDRDMDEVKEKIQIYAKAQPDTTFVEIEKALRSQGYGLYLIPKERTNLAITFTNMDLQGNLGKKYTVNYRFSDKPLRQAEREGWPENHDVVMERLAEAGDVVPWVGKPKCGNCEKLGHIRKDCPEQVLEADRAVVKCFNCDEEGHRPVPRVDKFACKNCGQSGHKVADCTEPRDASNVECRKCNEMGHFSKDCPTGGGSRGCRNCGEEGHMAKECDKPRDMSKVQCRNCDEYGHTGRECPKPRDYSRVQCQNCQEFGHTKVRCPKPHVDEDGGAGGNTAGLDSADAPVDAGGAGDWNNNSGGGDVVASGW